MIIWDELGCSKEVGAGATCTGATGLGVVGRSVGDVTGDVSGAVAIGEGLLLVLELGAGAPGLFSVGVGTEGVCPPLPPPEPLLDWLPCRLLLLSLVLLLSSLPNTTKPRTNPSINKRIRQQTTPMQTVKPLRGLASRRSVFDEPSSCTLTGFWIVLFASVLLEMTIAVDVVVARGFFTTVGLPPLVLPGFVLVDVDEANSVVGVGVGVGPFLLVGACFFGDVLLFAIVGDVVLCV